MNRWAVVALGVGVALTLALFAGALYREVSGGSVASDASAGMSIPPAPLTDPPQGLFAERTETAVREAMNIAVHCAVVYDIWPELGARYYMHTDAGNEVMHDEVMRRIARERERIPEDLSVEQKIEMLWGDRWGFELYFARSLCIDDDTSDLEL